MEALSGQAIGRVEKCHGTMRVDFCTNEDDEYLSSERYRPLRTIKIEFPTVVHTRPRGVDYGVSRHPYPDWTYQLPLCVESILIAHVPVHHGSTCSPIAKRRKTIGRSFDLVQSLQPDGAP